MHLYEGRMKAAEQKLSLSYLLCHVSIMMMDALSVVRDTPKHSNFDTKSAKMAGQLATFTLTAEKAKSSSITQPRRDTCHVAKQNGNDVS